MKQQKIVYWNVQGEDYRVHVSKQELDALIKKHGKLVITATYKYPNKKQLWYDIKIQKPQLQSIKKQVGLLRKCQETKNNGKKMGKKLK